MIKRFVIGLLAVSSFQFASAQSDDFGYELSVAGETKLYRGLKLELEGSMRTQDNAERIDRFVLGVGLSSRLYQSLDKKFSVKASAGFDYLWINNLKEKDNKYFKADDDLVDDGYFNEGDLKGYNITDHYWRKRYKINPGLTISYSPDKRWSFSLKEIVQYSHYCDATTTRTKWRIDEYNSTVNDDETINWIISPYYYDNNYTGEDYLDAEGNVIGKHLDSCEITKVHKDRTILRSRLSVSYDIKGFPIDIFASVEYGCGLNYRANKWKFTGGYDYKINKKNKLSLYYRYNTENDDDEMNGHLVGIGYKIDF